jgi:hypothetical protein
MLSSPLEFHGGVAAGLRRVVVLSTLLTSNGDQPFDITANLHYNFIFVVIWTHHTTFNVLCGNKLAILIQNINCAHVSSISGFNEN